MPEFDPGPLVAFDDRVGFTATREVDQRAHDRIREVVASLPEGCAVITGGCKGGDGWVARFAHDRGLHVHVVLPSDRRQVDPHWEEYMTTYEEMPPESGFRRRNARIIMRCTRLIAVPRLINYNPDQQSGTWMTCRIALKAGRPVTVLM